MNTAKQNLYEMNLYTNPEGENPSNRWADRSVYEPDVTIVVALFDGRNTSVPHSVGIYDESWVEKLYRGVARNYKGLFEFVCLTDRNYKFKEPIKQVRFSRSVDQYGWMSLMEWYHPQVCNTRRITMGLDTIITGPLDDIFHCDLGDHKIGVCTDPIYPKDICNAMTIAEPSFCTEFWDYWINNEKEVLRNCDLFPGAPSEMVVLRSLYGNSPCIDKLFPNRIFSYKTHIGSEDNLEYHSQIDTRLWRLHNSSIIYFHGVPKPHEVKGRWVTENWI